MFVGSPQHRRKDTMVSTIYVSRNKPAKPRLIIASESETRTGVPHFRPDIEGLRAVAVILVVLYHAGIKPVGGGYVGVDVFFVISGFLITTQLFNELSIHQTISVARFYARRATRLLPASTLVLLATVVGALLWLPPTRFKSISLDALAGTFYGINWRLAAQGVDYLNASAPPSPLQHFWSLAVEEQFYLVWPLLLLASSLAWRWRRATLSRASIIVALLALSIVSFTLSISQTHSASPWAYFGAHTRAWELALGALVAITAPYLTRSPRAAAAVATWLGLAAVLVSALLFTDATPFPGYAALLPVGGSALIIAGGCAAPAGAVTTIFRHRPFQLLGKLSYSWYLWHWPILLIAPAALHMTANRWLNLALAAGSLAVAAASYRFVENPIRSRRSLKTRPWQGISLGISLSASAAVVALIGGQLPLALGYGGPALDTRSVVAGAADPTKKLAELIADGVRTTAVPANLTPKLADAGRDSPAVYADGCHLSFTAVKANKACAYGDTSASTTVVLFGDSHAAQWFPALDQIGKARHWRVLSFTKSACPAASVLVYQDTLKRGYTECVQWRDQTLAAIKQMHPAMVIMTNNGTDTGGLVNTPGDPDQAWTAAWVASLNKVQQNGTKLVVLSDTPYPKSNAPDCVSTHVADVSACTRQASDALVLPKRRQLVADAAARSGALVLDPTPWFCTSTGCPVVVGNVLVYKDESHMSTAYATMLAPVVSAHLP
jgi:peptidoglycan/LPS O-acetylase OafA/YrhL